MFKPRIRNQMLFGISCLERFLHRNETRFQISDPPNKIEEDSEFSYHPKNTKEDSEFLISHRRQERISDLSKYTGKMTLNFWTPIEQDSYFLIPPRTYSWEESEFPITQTTWEKKFLSGLKAVTNLSLKSIKDSGVKRGLIIPPHKLYLIECSHIKSYHSRQGLNLATCLNNV